MSALDTVIVVSYFAVVFGIGAYFFTRAKTSRSYFLADRSVGWVAIGASLFATNISSEHFIGLVVVSLATQPESLAKLRGLTFATLEGDYTPPARDRRVITLQVAASVALVLLVTSLWIHFA